MKLYTATNAHKNRRTAMLSHISNDEWMDIMHAEWPPRCEDEDDGWPSTDEDDRSDGWPSTKEEDCSGRNSNTKRDNVPSFVVLLEKGGKDDVVDWLIWSAAELHKEVGGILSQLINALAGIPTNDHFLVKGEKGLFVRLLVKGNKHYVNTEFAEQQWKLAEKMVRKAVARKRLQVQHRIFGKQTPTPLLGEVPSVGVTPQMARSYSEQEQHIDSDSIRKFGRGLDNVRRQMLDIRAWMDDPNGICHLEGVRSECIMGTGIRRKHWRALGADLERNMEILGNRLQKRLGNRLQKQLMEVD